MKTKKKKSKKKTVVKKKLTYYQVFRKALPRSIAAKAIKNTDRNFSVRGPREEVLWGAFSWSCTEQGHDYWSDIQAKYGEKINAIVRSGM